MGKKHQSDNVESVLKTIVDTMQEAKAKEPVSLNMKKIMSAVTDYFVICHGTSKTQVDAIADKVIENVKKEHGINPYNREGFTNSEWILIDYVDIVVHVFIKSKRGFYQLEELWADAELVQYDQD